VQIDSRTSCGPEARFRAQVGLCSAPSTVCANPCRDCSESGTRVGSADRSHIALTRPRSFHLVRTRCAVPTRAPAQDRSIGLSTTIGIPDRVVERGRGDSAARCRRFQAICRTKRAGRPRGPFAYFVSRVMAVISPLSVPMATPLAMASRTRKESLCARTPVGRGDAAAPAGRLYSLLCGPTAVSAGRFGCGLSSSPIGARANERHDS
jgi:hypothetical protein